MELAGQLLGKAEIAYADGKTAGTGWVDVGEASLKVPGFGLSLEKLAARVEFTDLLMLTTKPAQKVSFTTGNAYSVALKDGRVSFRLEDASQLTIADFKVGLLGGQTTAPEFTFDLEEQTAETVFTCTDWELDQVLKLLPGYVGKASGRLSGRIPFQLKGSQYAFEKAKLTAARDQKGQVAIQELPTFIPPNRRSSKKRWKIMSTQPLLWTWTWPTATVPWSKL